MKYGDEYIHYKGNKYLFLGIALPIKINEMSLRNYKDISYVGSVRYHGDTHSMSLYGAEQWFFIDSELPHVIYQSENDYQTDKMWAREVNDFFDYVRDDNELVRRFDLLIKNNKTKGSSNHLSWIANTSQFPAVQERIEEHCNSLINAHFDKDNDYAIEKFLKIYAEGLLRLESLLLSNRGVAPEDLGTDPKIPAKRAHELLNEVRNIMLSNADRQYRNALTAFSGMKK